MATSPAGAVPGAVALPPRMAVAPPVVGAPGATRMAAPAAPPLPSTPKPSKSFLGFFKRGSKSQVAPAPPPPPAPAPAAAPGAGATAKATGAGAETTDIVNKIIKSIGDIITKIKGSPLIPSWSEFFIFICLAALFILWIILMHYTSVQRSVRSSRCYIEQTKYSNGSLYKVQANDPNNNPLYSITYDLGAKRFNHSCECPAGNVVNHWKNIPIYDLKTGQIDRNGLDKTCTCNKAYDTKTVYYRGNSGLVRFMNNKKDTSFFDKVDL